MRTNYQTAKTLGLVTVSESHVDISGRLKTAAEALLAELPLETLKAFGGVTSPGAAIIRIDRSIMTLADVVFQRRANNCKEDLPLEVVQMFSSPDSYLDSHLASHGAVYSVMIYWNSHWDAVCTFLGDWSHDWQVCHQTEKAELQFNQRPGENLEILPFSTLLGEPE